MSCRWARALSVAVAGVVTLGTAAIGFAYCSRIIDTKNCGDEVLDFVDHQAQRSYWSSCELARDYNEYQHSPLGTFFWWFIAGETVCGNITLGTGGVDAGGNPTKPLVWLPTDFLCEATEHIACP